VNVLKSEPFVVSSGEAVKRDSKPGECTIIFEYTVPKDLRELSLVPERANSYILASMPKRGHGIDDWNVRVYVERKRHPIQLAFIGFYRELVDSIAYRTSGHPLIFNAEHCTANPGDKIIVELLTPLTAKPLKAKDWQLALHCLAVRWVRL
jgi:hypothetical protein